MKSFTQFLNETKSNKEFLSESDVTSLKTGVRTRTAPNGVVRVDRVNQTPEQKKSRLGFYV